ncbi:MAG: DEAD/DEAH box helicase [Deltaproteobacteria bacterium]|nr:MAG: DEAD/DEAH box helicase [Deltaproteobacteria bacterium]
MAPVHPLHARAREHSTLSASSLTTTNESGFDRFGLHEALGRGIRAAGFETPRAIQSQVIPAALDGRDVLGLAPTGTGKTAAFALPLLDRMLETSRPGPRALILAPTRELAQQIDAEIRALARFTRVRSAAIFGGVSIRAQIGALARKPEIAVGCPGRILDLLGRGALDLAAIEALVLDEADHMFDMGFLPDVRRILGALPAQRQNLMFSATMPAAIRRLADAILRKPYVVELASGAPATTIDHALFAVTEEHKRDLLEQILSAADCESAIVFTRTKHRARRLAEQLGKRGHRSVALQGNMSQGQRDRAMRGFRERRYDVLVATDLAARGLDVSGVSHVINFDVPTTPEAYTHRIGRTGRAECSGIARTFVTRDDHAWLRATERMIGASIRRIGADEPRRSRRARR